MEISFSKKVKEEISKHIEKNINSQNVNRFTKVDIVKELRIKFLQNGSICDPNEEYHLEFNFSNIDDANSTIKMLSQCGISAKLSINKKKRIIVYLTDEKSIIEVLNLLGAISKLKEYKKVVEFKRQIKKINSHVNFETANIKRTVNAGISQIDDINKLLKIKNLDELDNMTKEFIYYRKKYPMLSLAELSEKMGNISKSGLNHRMIKIRKMIGKE